MSIVESVKMVMSNVDGNNNKFWQAEVDDNGGFHVINGRVGGSGQTQPVKHMGSVAAAVSHLNSMIRQKEKKGYTRFAEAAAAPQKSSPSNSKRTLAELASEQIRTNGHKDIIAALIKKMADANIHNILSNTTMKFNAETGYFSTPLGLVTRDSIDLARKTLAQLSVFIDAKQFDDPTAKRILGEYLMLIPQKVPPRLSVAGVIPNDEAVQKQYGILDSLIDSIAQAEMKNSIATNEEEKDSKPKEILFNASLSLTEDKAIHKAIDDMYRASWSRNHACSFLKVNRIFEISIDKMSDAYDKAEMEKDNVMRLWHGTRVGNILSIIKNGFIIEPESAGHVCGRMFGNGLYFSDQSTKSLNYAYGYWDGRAKDNVCYMFVCDVAMGKVFYPSHSDKTLHKFITREGYNSSFARAKQSGVQNNEMIVYETKRVKPVYLVEFSA